MTSAAKFIDDPALRKALEAKDEGSSDRGSIGTEATRAGILEKLAANTGLISIEKEKGIRAGMENHKTRPGVLRCTASLKSLNRISPLCGLKAVSDQSRRADS